MPFTVSHAAAALPFLGTRLPAAALVIGTMVPDLPSFVPLGIPRELSHSVPGVFGVDLPLGLLCVLLWTFAFRAPLHDYAPRWLRSRWRPRPWRPDGVRRMLLTVLLVLIALLVGVATHLLLDLLAHPDSPLVLAQPALRAPVGPLRVYAWLQYGVSVAGILVLAVWTVVWVRRTPPVALEAAVGRLHPLWRGVAWGGCLVVLVGVAVALWLREVLAGVPPLDATLLHYTAVFSIACAALVALAGCIAWYLLPRRTR